MKKSKLIIFASFVCFSAILKAGQEKAPTPNEQFSVNARIFLAGTEAKKQGAKGMAQLTKKEKSSASYLPYRNYKLITEKQKTTSLNKPCEIKFGEKSSVLITPKRSKLGRLKIKLQWHLPGRKAWEKTLFFKKNSKTLIGVPHSKKLGNYILSLEIK